MLNRQPRTDEALRNVGSPISTVPCYHGSPVWRLVRAVISRFASALDGLSKRFLDDPVYQAIVRRDLAEGQHRDGLPDSSRGRQSYFTTAYLHRPDEKADELASAGPRHETTVAIEGPSILNSSSSEQVRPCPPSVRGSPRSQCPSSRCFGAHEAPPTEQRHVAAYLSADGLLLHPIPFRSASRQAPLRCGQALFKG
jgi:hypothetical protein